jgi:hypothetical protein
MNKQLTPEQRKARLQLGLNIVVVGTDNGHTGRYIILLERLGMAQWAEIKIYE